MSNIRDVTEARIARSLATVFAQLTDMGIKRAETRPIPKPLTPLKRRAIRANLRKLLRLSVEELDRNVSIERQQASVGKRPEQDGEGGDGGGGAAA